MRKIAGLVLITIGVALVGFAVALPTYVYPRVAKLPANPNATLVAKGENVQVLKVRKDNFQVWTGTVIATRKVTNDSSKGRPAPGPNDVLWRSAFVAQTDEPKDNLLTAYVEGFTLDNYTGYAVLNAADYLLTDAPANAGDLGTPVRHRGLGLKFPFGTEQKSYPFWDTNMHQTTDMKFAGVETLKEMEVYRFVQTIPAHDLGTNLSLPGKLFGLKAENVPTHEIYETKRTVWVEPQTGVIVKGSEDINWRFTADGSDTVVPRTIGTLTYDDKTVTDQVETYRTAAKSLKFATSTGPLVCWILGPLALLAGVVLFAGARSGRDEDDVWDYEEPANPYV